jgi:hypothetical protein
MKGVVMRRLSPATAIALVALFFSLSGVAYAATGGTFVLGKANSAKTVTSLTNKKGTALSLSSDAADPSLTVSNSVQVPNLNASELDGDSSSAFLPASGTAVNSSELGGHTPGFFLPATGTAVNSNELGGTPASGYMQGGGSTTGTRLALTGQHSSNLLTSPGANLDAFCDSGGAGFGASLDVTINGGNNPGASVTWWNKDGVGTASLGDNFVTPGNGSTNPYVATVQVDNITSVSTFTASERYNSGTDTCSFTAQVVTTNG